MSLPTSRNRTYSAASKVRSADLNDLQDAVIEGWHGTLEGHLDAVDFHATSGSPVLQEDSAGVPMWVGGNSSASDVLYAKFEIPSGAHLRSVEVTHKRQTGTMTINVYAKDIATATASQVGTDLNISAGTTLDTQPVPGVDADVDAELAAGKVFVIRVLLAGVANTSRLYGVKYTFDKGVS